MSPVVTRVILAMALLVATPAVYLLAFAITYEIRGNGNDLALFAADILAGALFAGGWFTIWWHVVHWTRRRVAWTIIVTVISIILAIAIDLLVAILLDATLGVVTAGILWWAMWVGALALVWRESTTERLAHAKTTPPVELHCPHCGYDLRGLRDARCPECGTQYTLDELLTLLTQPRSGLDD